MERNQRGICGGCGLKRSSLQPSKWVGNHHLRCGACRAYEYDELKAEEYVDSMVMANSKGIGWYEE